MYLLIVAIGHGYLKDTDLFHLFSVKKCFKPIYRSLFLGSKVPNQYGNLPGLHSRNQGTNLSMSSTSSILSTRAVKLKGVYCSL